MPARSSYRDAMSAARLPRYGIAVAALTVAAFLMRLGAGLAQHAIVPEYVVGLENIGEFPNIVRWLVKHGYCDAEIVKAIGGNVVRLLEQTWWS